MDKNIYYKLATKDENGDYVEEFGKVFSEDHIPAGGQIVTDKAFKKIIDEADMHKGIMKTEKFDDMDDNASNTSYSRYKKIGGAMTYYKQYAPDGSLSGLFEQIPSNMPPEGCVEITKQEYDTLFAQYIKVV